MKPSKRTQANNRARSEKRAFLATLPPERRSTYARKRLAQFEQAPHNTVMKEGLAPLAQLGQDTQAITGMEERKDTQ